MIGGSERERISALRSIEYAAKTYQEWTAEKPPFGILSLRNSRSPSMVLLVASSWAFVFDPISLTPASIATAAPAGAVQAGTSQSNLLSSEVVAPHGLRQIYSGAISHEICHQYIALLAGSLSTPDLIDEAAAISCEPPIARMDQLSDFSVSKQVQYSHGMIDLFQTGHPIKHLKSSAVVAATGRGTLHTTELAIGEGDRMAESLNFFYGRAAMLQQFLRERSCYREKIIGEMIKHVSSSDSFSDWIRRHGREYCLSGDMKDFQKDFFKFSNEFMINHPNSVATPIEVF